MSMLTFDTLAGDKAQFHREYFGKKPLFRKGVVREPSELLSAAELDDLLSLEMVRPPYIKLNLNGTGVPEKGYTRSVVVQGTNVTDTVVASKVYELFKAGATVTWSSLNHLLPKMRVLADAINSELSVRTDPVAFLTPAGKKGYPPHHDPVDLFIVQLSGTKRWKLWDMPSPRKGDNASYSHEELEEPILDIVLSAGDVLYLPYGTPHAAVAEEQTSLHLSIMMRPRMWSDLLLETAKQIVSEDPIFNEYPLLARETTDETEAEFRQMAGSLATRLIEAATSRTLERLRAVPAGQGGHGRGDTFQSIVEADSLRTEASLVRTNVSLDIVEVIDTRATVRVNGSKIAMPHALADTLVAMEPGAVIGIDELPPTADSGRRLSMARMLVRLELVRAGV